MSELEESFLEWSTKRPRDTKYKARGSETLKLQSEHVTYFCSSGRLEERKWGRSNVEIFKKVTKSISSYILGTINLQIR